MQTEAKKTYQLTSINNFWLKPAGYLIGNDSGVVGMIDLLDPGRIGFTDQLKGSELDSGVCTLVGVMLYMMPEPPHNW